MPDAPKILLLDDEPDILENYRRMLSALKSGPHIVTSDSGARAIALLESEPFNLLITDLRMPKMDGLQVLSIVRRKFPLLRVMILTALQDDQVRSRAYAMGVDIFWEKPGTPKEITLFTECVESLIGNEVQGGFRGIQSKSLVDLIQLECLAQSSCVLRITNGKMTGQIWILNGDVIDASTGALDGEKAFMEIFSWRTGNFETLPADPERPRQIKTSYQGLLLDSAQATDEARGGSGGAATPEEAAAGPSRLALLGRFEGVEFVTESKADGHGSEAWGIENPEVLTKWAGRTLARFRQVGEVLQAGPLGELEGFGAQRHVAVAVAGEKMLCVGFRGSVSPTEARETMKKVSAKWAS